jgi:hypothetical protein
MPKRVRESRPAAASPLESTGMESLHIQASSVAREEARLEQKRARLEQKKARLEQEEARQEEEEARQEASRHRIVQQILVATVGAPEPLAAPAATIGAPEPRLDAP